MRWCLNNGVKIWYEPNKVKRGRSWFATGTYSITVDNRGTITTPPIEYTEKEVATKVYELYCYIYDANL